MIGKIFINDKFSFLFRNGNGIFLDPSLTHGKTERCATFDNQPLCQSEDFTIAAIEVYGLFKLDCTTSWKRK